ncbi:MULTISPECIES: quinone-dependent dihydroorotate dehydrogenase [Staphylococcus]|uniref:quinone-dependent dihydroorotate dehydrogenase n=1 Tax=Staphylococcus TaxID=1279 RepID=UPI001950A691|nr:MULTISPECIES: quinone-dependent dihydroorotate dehydrogenase [Staphylococcus]MCD8864034.1 quinone-dependent dihydroorotate dehydrogenase [Staphylococcus arlettae]
MYKLLKPLIFNIDPEQAHGMTINALKFIQKHNKLLSAVKGCFDYQQDTLQQQIAGVTFNNPIGLAAGFDKSCEVPKVLEMAGFGALELGGITPKPQPGNPKPRMYRLIDDQAIINRMGFNNIGMNKALSNLRKYAYHVPIGINIGVNKTTPYEERYQDYLKVMETFKYDATFFTVNISSPNTANLQNFHDKDEFAMLCNTLTNFQASQNITQPIFIKLTSDISTTELSQILPTIVDTFDGIILANTTQRRESLTSNNQNETGGLSGKPLFERNLELIKWTYQHTNGDFPIIGTGGIFTADDVIRMMRNGASLVQIYSSLIFEGPTLTKKMNKALASYLQQNNYHNIQELVGLDA